MPLRKSGTLVFSSLLLLFACHFPRCDPRPFRFSSVKHQSPFPRTLLQWECPHEDTNRCLLSDPPAQVNTWRSAPGAWCKPLMWNASVFEVRWLMVVICPAEQLFADVRMYTAHRNLSPPRSA